MMRRALAGMISGLVFSLVSSTVYGASIRSDMPAGQVITVWGVKHPNVLIGAGEEGTEGVEGIESVLTPALAPRSPARLGGFRALIPYVTSAPDQEGAGSCLYMAVTGAAEWWLRRLHPQVARGPEGPLDLSERYVMNQAGMEEDHAPVADWRTDSIYLWNQKGYGVLNRAYRYTKGWFKEAGDGYVAAEKDSEGSSYGTEFNWIDHRGQTTEAAKVSLPVFHRQVIFADLSHDPWNVGIAPSDIVEQVKTALRVHRAPVLVIYNHYGYWHAVLVVGYNDETTTEGCTFTKGMQPYLKAQSERVLAQAEVATEPKEKERLLVRGARLKRVSEKLTQSAEADPEHGCNAQGVFYVRDSIYTDPSQPLYDYDLSQAGEETHLGYPVILREYAWLKHVSNHITQITATL